MPDMPPDMDDVTRRILEQTLIPSPNVTALMDRKASGFVDRLRPEASGVLADVAELFHVNSKLNRHEPATGFTDAEVASVKDWFFASAGRIRAEDLTGAADRVQARHADLPPALAAVFAPFGPTGPVTRLLYGVDLGLIRPGESGARLYRQAPGADHLWLERLLDPSDWRAFRRAVPAPADELVGDDPIAVVTGAPWRTMLFHGPRGYRRALMDAGVLVNVIGSTAAGHGLDPRPVFDFYDDEVDGLLGNDGVERSVLALLVLRPPATPPATESGATP